MPTVTPAYVKNMMRRGLSELVDPSPDDQAEVQIWNHFKSACAYCGSPLRKGAKEAHIDHLVSASNRGANSLGNRVLSCAECNEKGKRDQPWEVFLRRKSTSPEEFYNRRQVIVEWQKRHPMVDDKRLEFVKNVAREKAAEVIRVFDQKVAETRKLLRG